MEVFYVRSDPLDDVAGLSRGWRSLADTLERATQRAEMAEANTDHIAASMLGSLQRSERALDWLERRNRYLEGQANALDADNRRLRRARIHDGALIREALKALIERDQVPQTVVEGFEEGAAAMLREDQEEMPESAP